MKTIALIDLLSGGHRDAFMRFFAKSCLELNQKVICIYPDTSLIKTWMDKEAPQYAANIIYIDHSIHFSFYNKFGRFNDALKALHSWRKSSALLKKAERENNVKIDLVFFNCIDNFMGNFIPPIVLDAIFPYKWSGLYFHPAIFYKIPEYINKPLTFRDIGAVFLSKNCVAVTLHDEGIIKKYEKRIRKSVLLFPEIADKTIPDANNKIAKEIREKANGRVVVGAIGLEPYKGSYELMKLAKAADPSKYLFAFTGDWGGEDWKIYFNDDTRAEEFFDFVNHLPENCYWKTGILSEGAEYNAVFNSFDVIWLMYKNFYSSSNRLTKAAIFNKLTLASDKGCVGSDVPRYSLGETADENDFDQQLKKLEQLRDRILSKDLPFEQWKSYAEKHSVESLNNKFAELLNLV